jgi:hypothetical protein
MPYLSSLNSTNGVLSRRSPINTLFSKSVLYLDAGVTSSYPGTGTTWFDLSGKNNNATLSTGYGYVSNGLKSYLTFNGIAGGATATVPTTTDFNFSTTDYTVGFWAFGNTGMNATNAYHGLFRINNNVFDSALWRSGLYNFGPDYSVMSGSVLFTTAFPLGGSANYLGNISQTYSYLNKWTNTVYVKSGNDVSMYINGELWATRQNGSVLSSSNSLTIGYQVDRPFWGNFGLFHINTMAMSASDVLRNYNVHKGRYGL